MKIVQKGNKQLRIKDEHLEAKLKAGYVEIDEKTGKPVKVKNKEPDVKVLETEIKALKAENAELKAQVDALTSAKTEQ